MKKKLGLEEGLDITKYVNPTLDLKQIELIYEGLKKGLNVSFYSKKMKLEEYEAIYEYLLRRKYAGI